MPDNFEIKKTVRNFLPITDIMHNHITAAIHVFLIDDDSNMGHAAAFKSQHTKSPGLCNHQGFAKCLNSFLYAQKTPSGSGTHAVVNIFISLFSLPSFWDTWQSSRPYLHALLFAGQYPIYDKPGLLHLYKRLC